MTVPLAIPPRLPPTSDTLFCVRLAQGWLHSGKGLITMAPYHSDGLLMIPAAMAGILTTLHLSFDLKNTFLGKFHHLIYTLTSAMRPRMVMAVNEDREPIR